MVRLYLLLCTGSSTEFRNTVPRYLNKQVNLFSYSLLAFFSKLKQLHLFLLPSDPILNSTCWILLCIISPCGFSFTSQVLWRAIISSSFFIVHTTISKKQPWNSPSWQHIEALFFSHFKRQRPDIISVMGVCRKCANQKVTKISIQVYQTRSSMQIVAAPLRWMIFANLYQLKIWPTEPANVDCFVN